MQLTEFKSQVAGLRRKFLTDLKILDPKKLEMLEETGHCRVPVTGGVREYMTESGENDVLTVRSKHVLGLPQSAEVEFEKFGIHIVGPYRHTPRQPLLDRRISETQLVIQTGGLPMLYQTEKHELELVLPDPTKQRFGEHVDAREARSTLLRQSDAGTAHTMEYRFAFGSDARPFLGRRIQLRDLQIGSMAVDGLMNNATLAINFFNPRRSNVYQGRSFEWKFDWVTGKPTMTIAPLGNDTSVRPQPWEMGILPTPPEVRFQDGSAFMDLQVVAKKGAEQTDLHLRLTHGVDVAREFLSVTPNPSDPIISYRMQLGVKKD